MFSLTEQSVLDNGFNHLNNVFLNVWDERFMLLLCRRHVRGFTCLSNTSNCPISLASPRHQSFTYSTYWSSGDWWWLLDGDKLNVLRGVSNGTLFPFKNSALHREWDAIWDTAADIWAIQKDKPSRGRGWAMFQRDGIYGSFVLFFFLTAMLRQPRHKSLLLFLCRSDWFSFPAHS